jgi:hypothetical protein
MGHGNREVLLKRKAFSVIVVASHGVDESVQPLSIGHGSHVFE